MNFRVIYIIEVINSNYELIARRYARNKKTAAKIERQYKDQSIMTRKISPAERRIINLEWVEG